MSFPDIEDLQLIVASYVSDFITLMNLSHLWKIPNLGKLRGDVLYYVDEIQKHDSKLHQYMNLAVDLESEIPYIHRNIKSLIIKSDDIKKTIKFLDTFPVNNTKISLRTDDIKNTGNLFEKHKIQSTSVTGLYNSESDFLKNITSEKISLSITCENKVKLSLHKSVSTFDIKIDSGLYPEFTIPEDSILGCLYSKANDKSIQNILKYHPFKKLKQLGLEHVENLKFLKNPYLKNLLYLNIDVTDNEDAILWEFADGKINFLLRDLDLYGLTICSEEYLKIQISGKLVLSNPETLKYLSLNFSTELYDFCFSDEFGYLKSIFYNYSKLESFTFIYSKTMYFIEDSKNIINFLPSVNILTIKINTPENSINRIIYIPESTHTLILEFENRSNDMAEFLSKLRFENILNIRKLTIVSDNTKFIYLLQDGARIFSEMKKLETIELLCGFLHNNLSLSLPDLLEQLPDSLVNMQLICAKIDSDLKFIDFRKFRKLRYLHVSIICETRYSNPIIYLPIGSGSGILQAKIIKRCDSSGSYFRFKNIRGLYIKN